MSRTSGKMAVLLMKVLFTISAFSAVYCLYTPSQNVIDLTSDNFDAQVIDSPSIWIVEFYSPGCGHCVSFAPEYAKAASALKGIVKVGAVNMAKYSEFGSRFGIKGFPTVKIFGRNKKQPIVYNGERTAQALARKALDVAQQAVDESLGVNRKSSGSGDAVELTDSNFASTVLNSVEPWLVGFFAPWCGHCKNLAPHWSKAATQLKGKVNLGSLDATAHQHTASKYGIQGYPTIKFFGANKQQPINYDGGRTADDIVNWALDKLAENIPAPEVIEITSASVFKQECVEKSLCVVAVLPDIYDCQADCRNEYLKMLATVANEFKKNMWGWLWSSALAQSDLEQALDIGGFGYPALAVVSMKKMKYSLLRGSFSKEGIGEFVRNLGYGRGASAPIARLETETIVDVVPWDGKDAPLPAFEDIDLSDVDLDLDSKDEL